jgi:hypothetical protein
MLFAGSICLCKIIPLFTVKVLYSPANSKVSQNRFQLTSMAHVLGRWTFFFNFKGVTILDFSENFVPPLELILMVMWEKIGEVLKIVCSAYQFAKTWYQCQ